MDRKVRVYLAAPYTIGDVAVHVHLAIRAGERLAEVGLVPFIPHLAHLWHLVVPHDLEFWYSYSLEWLAQCDVLLRLPGESAGADVEVRFAKQHGITVYEDIDFLIATEVRKAGQATDKENADASTE